MALIECPVCGKRISEKADCCRHCGFPISEEIILKYNLRNKGEQSEFFNSFERNNSINNVTKNITLSDKMSENNKIKKENKSRKTTFILVCLGIIIIIIITTIGKISTNTEKYISQQYHERQIKSSTETVMPNKVESARTEIPKKIESTSLALKLATIEKNGYVAEHDILVKKFNSLLTQLDNKFVENKEQIADKTVAAKKLIEKEGITASMIEIMEGMNILRTPKDNNKVYNKYITIYVILRKKIRSHNKTIDDLQSSLEIVSIDFLMNYAGI